MLLHQARHIFPASCDPSEVLPHALRSIERTPHVPEPTGDPQRDAVYRAIGAASFTERAHERAAPDLGALARSLVLPIEPFAGEHRLLALLPPPEGLGPAWVAIYRDPDYEHSYETEAAHWGNWDEKHHRGIRIERVRVPPETRPALYHYAARTLVPVDFVPFLDLDAHGCWDATDLSSLPTTPEPYIVAELFSRRSKIGGLPVLNEHGVDPPIGSDAEWMRYAYHLAADFFDCEFGDAASLHVYLSPTTGEGVAIVDSA